MGQPKDAMGSVEWVVALAKELGGLNETYYSMFLHDLRVTHSSSIHISRRLEALEISLQIAAQDAFSLASALGVRLDD